MTDKLNVLHVIGAKNAGGAETFALRLFIAQHKDDRFNVTCVVRKGSWIEEQLRSEGVPTMTAPFGKMLDFRTTPIIRNAIDILEIDIVQGWMNRACSKLPEADVATLGRMGGYYKLKNYDNCHVIAGNTTKICDYLADNGLDPDEIAYLPNFTEADSSTMGDRESVRKDLNIPEDVPVAIIAGRLHPVKGIDVAIGAATEIEGLHLIILGEGAEKANLKQITKECGIESNVHFMGWQRQISKFAAAADVWWVPSRHEPLGNAVLDGWMHKKPVIASKTDGPTLLIENDASGKLVEIEDANGLAEATKDVLENSNKAEAIKAKGYEIVQSTNSEQAILDIYYKTYVDMAQNKGFLKECQYKGKKAL